MKGSMMDYPLTLQAILERNEKYFSEEEIRRALEELAHYGLLSHTSI